MRDQTDIVEDSINEEISKEENKDIAELYDVENATVNEEGVENILSGVKVDLGAKDNSAIDMPVQDIGDTMVEFNNRIMQEKMLYDKMGIYKVALQGVLSGNMMKYRNLSELEEAKNAIADVVIKLGDALFEAIER